MYSINTPWCHIWCWASIAPCRGALFLSHLTLGQRKTSRVSGIEKMKFCKQRWVWISTSEAAAILFFLAHTSATTPPQGRICTSGTLRPHKEGDNGGDLWGGGGTRIIDSCTVRCQRWAANEWFMFLERVNLIWRRDKVFTAECGTVVQCLLYPRKNYLDLKNYPLRKINWDVSYSGFEIQIFKAYNAA